MENNLVNVKVKSGTFYISSKEDKGEGWEKQTFKNPQNKEEILTRWHKNVSIKGKVNMLKMDDDKYKGKVLNMIVGGEDESYALQVPIMDNGGTVKTTNKYFNSLVGSLENVKKGEEVTMFVNSKYEDKNGRLYRNIVVLDSEGKLIKSNFELSEVPRWIENKTKDEFDEEIIEWDASPANKFYIDLFKKVVSNFEGNTTTTNSSNKPQSSSKPSNKVPTATPEEAFEPAGDLNIDDHDDLPF